MFQAPTIHNEPFSPSPIPNQEVPGNVALSAEQWGSFLTKLVAATRLGMTLEQDQNGRFVLKESDIDLESLTGDRLEEYYETKSEIEKLLTAAYASSLGLEAVNEQILGRLDDISDYKQRVLGNYFANKEQNLRPGVGSVLAAGAGVAASAMGMGNIATPKFADVLHAPLPSQVKGIDGGGEDDTSTPESTPVATKTPIELSQQQVDEWVANIEKESILPYSLEMVSVGGWGTGFQLTINDGDFAKSLQDTIHSNRDVDSLLRAIKGQSLDNIVLKGEWVENLPAEDLEKILKSLIMAVNSGEAKGLAGYLHITIEGKFTDLTVVYASDYDPATNQIVLKNEYSGELTIFYFDDENPSDDEIQEDLQNGISKFKQFGGQKERLVSSKVILENVKGGIVIPDNLAFTPLYINVDSVTDDFDLDAFIQSVKVNKNILSVAIDAVVVNKLSESELERLIPAIINILKTRTMGRDDKNGAMPLYLSFDFNSVIGNGENFHNVGWQFLIQKVEKALEKTGHPDALSLWQDSYVQVWTGDEACPQLITQEGRSVGVFNKLHLGKEHDTYQIISAENVLTNGELVITVKTPEVSYISYLALRLVNKVTGVAQVFESQNLLPAGTDYLVVQQGAEVAVNFGKLPADIFNYTVQIVSKGYYETLNTPAGLLYRNHVKQLLASGKAQGFVNLNTLS